MSATYRYRGDTAEYRSRVEKFTAKQPVGGELQYNF
jgi:hypothetical protein